MEFLVTWPKVADLGSREERAFQKIKKINKKASLHFPKFNFTLLFNDISFRVYWIALLLLFCCTEYIFVILEEFWCTKFNKRATWKLGSWDRAAEKPHNGELIQFSNAENKTSRGQTWWILTTFWDVLPPVCSPEFLIQSWGGKMAADSVQVRKLNISVTKPTEFLINSAYLHF